MPNSIWDERPTASMIDSTYIHLRELWNIAHARWRRMDQFYWNNFALWPDGVNRPQSHPATPTQLIDHAADTQLAYDPIVHREPLGESAESAERADKIKSFVSAVLEEASLLEPVLPFKQFGKHMLMYGYAVLEGPLLDLTAQPDRPSPDVPDYDEKLGEYTRAMWGWNPVRLRCPHPSNVLLDPLEKAPPVAVKLLWKYAGDLYYLTKKKGRRALYKWPEPTNFYELIEVKEYWTKKWHALMAKDELLYVEPNTWGFVPFTHAFSGFGMEITRGNQNLPLTLAGNNPRWMAIGLLDPIEDSLLRHAQQVTAKHNMMMNMAWTPLVTKGSGADLAQQLARGEIIEGVNGQDDMWWMKFPDAPQWMFQTGAETAADIEEGTYAQSLAGVRETGVTTVGQQAILSNAAARKFAAPAAQMNYVATIVGQNILRLVHVLDEKISVRGQSASPSDIDGNFSLEVRFELVDPAIQIQERQMGLSEVQAGIKSAETYRRFDLRLEDETGEQKRLLKDEIRKMPAVHMFLLEQVMREEGLYELADHLEEQRKELLAQQAEQALELPQPQVAPGQSPANTLPELPGNAPSLGARPRGGRALPRFRQPEAPQAPVTSKPPETRYK